MAARSETSDPATRVHNDATKKDDLRARAWRYAPLLAWTALIFFLSTGAGSSTNTSLIIEPLARWLFPRISASRIDAIHFAVRKCAHFTGYATLALLAARAFLPSSKDFLRRHWLVSALIYVVCVALLDEFNQSFNPARTGTIKDSALDTFGGACALTALAYLRIRRARSHTVNVN
jgi:VanZ family protein